MANHLCFFVLSLHIPVPSVSRNNLPRPILLHATIYLRHCIFDSSQPQY